MKYVATIQVTWETSNSLEDDKIMLPSDRKKEAFERIIKDTLYDHLWYNNISIIINELL